MFSNPYYLFFSTERMVNKSVKYLEMDIYYSADVILKYRTYLDVRLVNFLCKNKWVIFDLIVIYLHLATIGGLVSLFMGASLTSFIEVLYYSIYAIIQLCKPRIIGTNHSHFKKKY